MKPYGSIDREYPYHSYRGVREDGRNLIEEWITAVEDEDAEYVRFTKWASCNPAQT